MKTANPTPFTNVQDKQENQVEEDFKDLLETPAGNFSNKRRFLIGWMKEAINQAKLEERKLVLSEIGEILETVNPITISLKEGYNTAKQELRQKTLKRIESLEKQ